MSYLLTKQVPEMRQIRSKLAANWHRPSPGVLWHLCPPVFRTSCHFVYIEESPRQFSRLPIKWLGEQRQERHLKTLKIDVPFLEGGHRTLPHSQCIKNENDVIGAWEAPRLHLKKKNLHSFQTKQINGSFSWESRVICLPISLTFCIAWVLCKVI